jgi:predicted metal-dependent HD superfamily phosphohydrolase
VRREYAFVPEADYRAGRSRVLRSFLDRPILYRTVTDKAAWTGQAHRNLCRELAVLEPAS